MFSGIAHRYDLMNRVMTAGRDISWRREVIRRARIPENGALLDLGTGTGDLAFEALRQCPSCRVDAADFTIEMMRIGNRRSENLLGATGRLGWSAADASQLPFPDNQFDAAVSGFLLRNVNDVSRCLAEQYRVLAPGGRIVALDTTPPPQSCLSPLIKLHLRYIIPALGTVIAGQSDAYRYLPDSTEAFLHPQQLSVRLLKAGFREVGYQHLMFGTVAIYWGTKSMQESEPFEFQEDK
jgi:demethylmenaquinone methyltransferase/2-methoxy-6-polyprenyl-1,4-benzoquinol methylase